MEFEIYILGFPTGESGKTSLDIQDECYNLAVNFMTYIDNMPQFTNLMNLYDWSILTLDRYSEANMSGVKLSLVLNVVSPINLCTFEDWFNDEPYTPEQDHEIDISGDTVSEELEIKPIHLPRNRTC